MVKTERQLMFEDKLKELSKKVYGSGMTYIDAVVLLEIGNKLLLGFEEIVVSRDKWKAKYMELKNSQSKPYRNNEVKDES